MLVVCASTLPVFHFSIFTSVLAQNYSSADTVTEYPNKGTYYHDKFEGRTTASGEVFDQNAFTAAHWRIKLGTYILVTNQNTGLQVIVKVNDRCPRHGVIDLSHRAATAVGIRGCQPVTVRLLSDDYEEQWLAQEMQFDSVRSRRHPDLPTALEVLARAAAASSGETVGTSDSSPDVVVSAPAASPSTGHSKPHDHPASQSLANGRYNLILCNVATHGEAYNNIQKLPPKFQEMARVEAVGDSSDLRVSLDVRLPRTQVDALRRTLSSSFPKVSVIPATGE